MNNIINQLNLNDIYRKFQPTTAGYTIFSNAIGHILGCKAGLNNFKRIETVQSCIFGPIN